MMETFEIAFTRLGDLWVPHKGKAAAGHIRIGDYLESFLAPLDRLSRMDYMEQWASALQHLVRFGKKSALLTSYRGGNEVVGERWALYPVGDRVLIQNQLILANIAGPRFNPRKADAAIPPHRSVNEEGRPISEWSITLGSLHAFHHRLQSKLARIRSQRSG